MDDREIKFGLKISKKGKDKGLILHKKWFLTSLVVVLGIAIVGVANAATIKNSLADQSPKASTSITVSSAVSADLVNQMIQNCWQFNQTLVDQWVKTSGLSQQDLLKMEQSWMQGVMQQNPNLTLQEALKMEQTWLLNNIANFQKVAMIPQQSQTQQAQTKQQVQPTQQVQPAQQVQQPQQSQPTVRPQTPPVQKTYQTPYYGNRNYSYGNRNYSNWNCGW
ncbi:hypothetical protein [Desulfotomaculum nigrificans]|uniref:hypothetical protein n=1 Tax=Desulfotomaculum nigrificans TaxID=1565 RepID=UPI0001FAE781|nr:hypothetical protein [Desulfotomaculum nigrificans]MDA8235897.1 hypothetical protein [Clostridia bacterium]